MAGRFSIRRATSNRPRQRGGQLKPPEQRRSICSSLRVSQEEFAAIHECAARDGKRVQTWIREAAMEKARKV
jgi:uncharacterized protein (DUF1778 family)